MEIANEQRVLAIHATSRGFGYAVMENDETLLDWGVIELHKNYSRSSVMSSLAKLQERYRPTVIVVKAMSDISDKRKRALKFLKSLTNTKMAVHLAEVSNYRLSKAFPDAKNKYDRAKEICSKFSFLLSSLPDRRLFYQSENYRMAYFDAISLGIAFYIT